MRKVGSKIKNSLLYVLAGAVGFLFYVFIPILLIILLAYVALKVEKKGKNGAEDILAFIIGFLVALILFLLIPK